MSYYVDSEPSPYSRDLFFFKLLFFVMRHYAILNSKNLFRVEKWSSLVFLPVSEKLAYGNFYSVWHQLKGPTYFNIPIMSTFCTVITVSLQQYPRAKSLILFIPKPPTFSVIKLHRLYRLMPKQEITRMAGFEPNTWRPSLKLETGLLSFSHVRMGAGMPLASHSSCTRWLTTAVTMSLLSEIDGGTEKRK